MKKLYYLIILALILGLVLTGCFLSNVGQVPATGQGGVAYLTKGGPTESEADSYPLYAGQDWLVGEVLVWDDGTQLCVKYQLFSEIFDEGDGWGITETHLAVATSLEGIPTNKSGNPQPGKFPYGNDELGGVESWPETDWFCIPLLEDLSVGCGDTVFIAAHAVIEKCVTVQDTLVPELTWTRSSESDVAVFSGFGAQWTKVQGFMIDTNPTELVWDGGTATQNFTGYTTRGDINWASWICTQNASGKSLTGTDLRRFNATFDISAGYTVTGGTLGSVNPGYGDVIPMNDNIYIFVNEELLFWGGTIEVVDPLTTTFMGMLGRMTQPKDVSAFPETDGWHMDGTFPAIPSGLFNEGSNKLDVFAEEFWTGGGMHELGLTLQVEQTTCETETAWAANDEIEGDEEGTIQFIDSKSWATYFTYIVESWEETLTIPADVAGEAGRITSTHSLTAGHTYKFVASGTCFWRNEFNLGGYLADAEYWLRHDSYGEGWVKMNPGSIAIWNGSAAVNIDWGALDEIAHIYTIEYTPSATGPITFFFYDDVYSDNSGSLTLKIYSCFKN